VIYRTRKLGRGELKGAAAFPCERSLSSSERIMGTARKGWRFVQVVDGRLENTGKLAMNGGDRLL
jgi:hypothetical protein